MKYDFIRCPCCNENFEKGIFILKWGSAYGGSFPGLYWCGTKDKSFEQIVSRSYGLLKNLMPKNISGYKCHNCTGITFSYDVKKQKISNIICPYCQNNMREGTLYPYQKLWGVSIYWNSKETGKEEEIFRKASPNLKRWITDNMISLELREKDEPKMSNQVKSNPHEGAICKNCKILTFQEK